MKDAILIIILVIIAGGAALCIYRAKKQGRACMGCSCSAQCSGKSCCKPPEDQTE